MSSQQKYESAKLGKFITDHENSLTASVFTHLLHLPCEVFWQILRNSCYTDRLPEYPGEPLRLEFRPKWDPEGTDNNHHVEPDVFIVFASFDLIIEAKRWDQRMQKRDQWQNELIAYTNENGTKKRGVCMIALGGLHSYQDDEISQKWTSTSTNALPDKHEMHDFVCRVHMCSWQALLHQCQRMEHELQLQEYQSAQSFAHRRVLLDLIDLFSSFGYQTGRWFEEIIANSKLPHLGPGFPSHHITFQCITSQHLHI